MDPALLELRDRFFRILDEGGPAHQVAQDVWALFVEHSSYQDELSSIARRVLTRGEVRRGWGEEVMQNAMLLLGTRLRRRPGLRINRAIAEEHFGGWLAKVILRDCQQAVRSMRRTHRRTPMEQGNVEGAAAEATSINERVDLAAAIWKLPELCRKVLKLRRRGAPVDIIAKRVNRAQGASMHCWRRRCRGWRQSASAEPIQANSRKNTFDASARSKNYPLLANASGYDARGV